MASKSWLIAAALLLLQVASAAPQKKYTLPQGSGPYRVHLDIKELDDRSRQDPWNSSHIRRLMVSRFDPQEAADCKKTKKTPYFPAAVARAEAVIEAQFDLPDIWNDFELETCATRVPLHKSVPVTLFSPGFNTTRLYYSVLAMEIASHGYTVITIDHPYDVDVVQFPNGDIIYGNIDVDNIGLDPNDPLANKILNVRSDDCRFVLDSEGGKDCHSIVWGHSIGGAAAAIAMAADERFRGGINIDGTQWGQVVLSGFPNPKGRSFMLWGSTGHNSSQIDVADGNDDTWPRFWDAMAKEKDLWKREMTVHNTSHNAYWDVNLLVDVAGVRDQLDATAQVTVAPTHGARIYQIFGKYLPAYFDFALGGPESPLYERPAKGFPDVDILRR